MIVALGWVGLGLGLVRGVGLVVVVVVVWFGAGLCQNLICGFLSFLRKYTHFHSNIILLFRVPPLLRVL